MAKTLYITSHWQGARPQPLGTIPDDIDAADLVDRLSTCSFCTPGRTAQYSTGTCYGWRHTRADYGPLSDELLDQAEV